MLKIGALVGLILASWVAAASAAESPSATAEDTALGRADAPVTIIEYASLTCPHCAHFHAETLPRVQREWIDTGKARLVFRDYPLDKLALIAAMMTRCAERSVYFDLLGDLFAKQDAWSLADDAPAALAQIGQAHGMKDETIRACWVDNDVANNVIEGAYAAEKQYEVGSTPTFFINGAKFEGDQGWDAFNQALESATAKKP
jgi:protein-disulfide isomerase